MTARVTPTPFDRVLSLRPTNVVTRLGAHSRVPILNPRDLAAALEALGAGLVCVPVFARSAASGVLKAARDQDAVVGLGCPYPLADRDSPARFVDTVRGAAEEFRHRQPFFLQAGPFRLATDDVRAREQLGTAIYRYVEAGFTLITLDASRLDVDAAAAAYRELSASAAERELSIEITTLVDSEGRFDAGGTRAVLERLAKSRVLVNFLRLPGTTYALEPSPRETWQLDQSVVREASSVATDFRASLSIEDEGSAPDSLAEVWQGCGVRKMDPWEASARIALGGFDATQTGALRDEARASRLHPRDLIARLERTSEDSKAALKAEALSWSMTLDTLAAVRARGSASRAVSFLAQGGRY